MGVQTTRQGRSRSPPGPTCECRGQVLGPSSQEAVAAAAAFHRPNDGHDPPGWGLATHMMGVHDAVREPGGGLPLQHPLSRQGHAGKQQPQQVQRLTGGSRCGHRQPSRMHRCSCSALSSRIGILAGHASSERVATLRQRFGGHARLPCYNKFIMRLKPSRQAGGCSRARRSARHGHHRVSARPRWGPGQPRG